MRSENETATAQALEMIAWLDSTTGRHTLTSLKRYEAADALALTSRLRADGIAPHLASAALTQVRLREAARPRMGDLVDDLIFTEDGAQQATRTIVAQRHADRFARAGVRHVADLGCGLGADSIAFFRAGLSVTAVELDPTTAAIAEANLNRAAQCREGGGLPNVAAAWRATEAGALALDRAEHLDGAERLDATPTARVIQGDAIATAASLDPEVAIWADPARRRGGRRIQDPEQWSPPLSSVLALSGSAADAAPRGFGVRSLGVKAAPGIDHATLPTAAEVEFVSVDGALVEACIWLGPVCEQPGRVAVVMQSDNGVAVLREDTTAHPSASAANSPVRMADVRPLGEFLYEPDDAALRAGLVARAGELLGPQAAAGIVSPGIAYLTGDAWPENSDAAPFLTPYRILEVLPLTTKKLKSRLRALGATSVAIKKRGVRIDPEVLRRDLGYGSKAAKKRGGTQMPHEATLIVTPVAGKVQVLLVESLR